MFERNSSVEYREIPGFPGYEVGSDGSVWSFWSNNGTICRNVPKCLKQVTESGKRGPRYFRSPYKRVSLSRNKRTFHLHVHRLVLEAFVGPCPEGMETRHLDTNPENNRLENLTWGTKKENGEDKRISGNSKGDKNGRSKLTSQDVLEIRRLRFLGMTHQAIADQFGVSNGLIGFIVRGKIWTHVN